VSIDEHPLRYSQTTREIEQILIRRLFEKRLDGYTLEAAIEIADAVSKVYWPK
jgi:hypothetical protein